MQEQLSDGHVTPETAADNAADAGPADDGDSGSGTDAPRRRRRRKRTDWRLGGTAVRRWDGIVLAVALVFLGIGVFASTLIPTLGSSPVMGLISQVALWVGMLVPVIYAFMRGRPAGLLKFRPVDLLYAVTLGILLRLLQGWMTDAASQPFPSATTLDGSLPSDWIVREFIPSALIAPTVEEFFFRTVLLVSIYSMLRRAAGSFAAGFAAVLVSTATFILMHAVDGSLPVIEALTLGAVGLTCSLLVILTGRIWGAVLVHIVYNATMLGLIAIGTVLR